MRCSRLAQRGQTGGLRLNASVRPPPRRLVHAPKSEAMKRSFRQVNVFSSDPLLGNPLAVVHAADGLSEEQMAAFARWTHLSETTYLLAPTDAAADYRVRIFTPGGHPPRPTCGLPCSRRPATGPRSGGTALLGGVRLSQCFSKYHSVLPWASIIFDDLNSIAV